MKFAATQSAVLKSLTLVSGGISKAGESAMVRINANKETGTIVFEAKNLDVRIKSFLKSEVLESGQTSVEFIKLMEVIKKLPSAVETSFETKDFTLFIKSNKSKFSIKGIDFQQAYKEIGQDKSSSFRVMSKQILGLIEKTRFSIFPDEARFNLNGLHLKCTELNGKSILAAVSTDGHRLSFCSLEVESSQIEGFSKIIIPKKSTLELRKVLDSMDDEEVEVNVVDKQFVLSSQSIYFVSKLIDAEFPDYEKIIPVENSKVVSIPRKDLISLIERVSAIHAGSSESSVSIHFFDNLLKVSAKNKDTGEAADEIPIECNFTEPLSVNYNYTYLLEILSHITSEKVVFCLKDERTSALLKDENLESYFYILMPMRF